LVDAMMIGFDMRYNLTKNHAVLKAV